MACGPPGSSVHGSFQARIQEWVAISSSRGSSWPRDQTHISCVPCIGRWILYRCATWEVRIYSLLLLLLSRFSRVWLCATPQMAAHQAPPSLGFSRQEHWSGLPFPSPMHESEKWKWSRSVLSDSSRPHGLQSSRLLHPWDFPGRSAGVGCDCLLQQSRETANLISINLLSWMYTLTSIFCLFYGLYCSCSINN